MKGVVVEGKVVAKLLVLSSSSFMDLQFLICWDIVGLRSGFPGPWTGRLTTIQPMSSAT